MIKTFTLKVLKFFKILLIIFVIIISGHILFEKYVGFDDPSYSLGELMNHAFGLPGAEKPYFVKNDDSVFNFDKANLFNYKCKYWLESEWNSPDLHQKSFPYLTFEEFAKVKDEKLLAHYQRVQREYYPDLSLEEVKQVQCMEFHEGSSSTRFKSNLHKELCSNTFTCKIRVLLVNSYVLEAGLLPKIIKILERPCDYIEEPREGMTYRDKERIKLLKSSFSCNRTLWSRVRFKYTLLELVDYEAGINYNVVVERKDIK